MYLRSRICLLIALAGIPALAFQVFNEFELAQAREDDAKDRVLRLATNEAAQQNASLEGAKRFLTALAQSPSVQNANDSCGKLLADTVRRLPEYDMIGVADRGGRLVCNSAKPDQRLEINVSDQPHFKQVRETRQFAVGTYSLARLTGSRVLQIGYPLLDVAGNFHGVIYASLSLKSLSEELDTRELPPGGSLLVTDREGTVLYRRPDMGKDWIGTSALEHVAPLLAASKPGVRQVPGLDGIARLFSYVPSTSSGTNLFFSVGMRQDLAFAEASSANRRALFLIAAGFFLSIIAAWFGAGALIRRPAHQLIEAAESWRRGDYTVRAGGRRKANPTSEFERIASAFDGLVDAVQAREADLNALNSTLEARAAQRAKELAATERHYRTYFEHTAESLFVVDVCLDGTFRLAGLNPAHQRATGLRVEDVIDRPLEEALAPELAAPLCVRFRRCVEAGAPIRYSETLDLPGGAREWDTILAPMRDESGRIVRILGSARDVTEQRRTEAQLRRVQRMEAIGQLTGGIAHDFNNLLTAVIGNLALIKGRLSTDSKLHRLADNGLQAATRGAQLTSQLLSFARRQRMDPAPADAGALVAQMSGILRRAAGEAIEIETLVPAELWPCRVDAAQFEAALLNLVINARDAMPKGGRIAIRIANTAIGAEDYRTLDLKAPGDYVRVSVTDTGSGMDEATQARVFEPFFTTKETGKGSGLGLPMVHGFAAQSGGAVAINSALGQGTTMSIYLPRCAERPAGVEEEPMDEGMEIILPGRTVLVLEDEPEVLNVACSALEATGCSVIAARNGEEALEALRGPDRIDVLFADIVLPGGMNGLETAHAACRIRPGLDVLLTSGYAEEILSRSGVKPDNLLRKPYLPKDLVKRIAALLATPPAANGPWAA